MLWEFCQAERWKLERMRLANFATKEVGVFFLVPTVLEVKGKIICFLIYLMSGSALLIAAFALPPRSS